MPAAIAFFTGSTQFEIPYGTITAASVTISIPLIIMVLLFQKRIVAGLTARAVAALAVVASVGALVAVVVAFSQVPDQLRDELTGVGISDPSTGHTGWYWAAGVGAVLSVVATVLAVAWAPDWPEMGSRYDAPGATAPTAAVDPEDQSSLDLWKAMDEGRDPTAPPAE